MFQLITDGILDTKNKKRIANLQGELTHLQKAETTKDIFLQKQTFGNCLWKTV